MPGAAPANRAFRLAAAVVRPRVMRGVTPFRVAPALGLFGLLAFVFYKNAYAFVQKGLFTKPLRQLFETVNRCFKNARIRPECDLGAAFRRRAGLFQRCDRDAGLIFLLMRFTVAPDLQL